MFKRIREAQMQSQPPLQNVQAPPPQQCGKASPVAPNQVMQMQPVIQVQPVQVQQLVPVVQVQQMPSMVQVQQMPPPPPYNMTQAPPPYDSKTSNIGGANTKTVKNDALDQFLHKLAAYNVVFVIDDSTSMNIDDQNDGLTRWKQALEALQMVVPMATKYDDDGVDVCFINNPQALNVSKNQDIIQLMAQLKVSPRGGTELGTKLSEVFENFLSELRKKLSNPQYRVKPISMIVITDGAATDLTPQYHTHNVIVKLCKDLMTMGCNPIDWIGIQFFQVGNDENAKKYLSSLDDDLKTKYGIPDIVDFTPYDTNSHLPLKYILKKVMLGGIDGDVDQNAFQSQYSAQK